MYDTQKIEVDTLPPSPSESPQRLLIFCLRTTFLSCILVLLSAFGKWDGPWFFINAIRLSVPPFLLALILFGVLYYFVVPHPLGKRQGTLFVGRSRQDNSSKPGMLRIFTSASSRSETEKVIWRTGLSIFCICVAWWSANSSEITTLLICGLSGVFSDIFLFNIPLTFWKGRLSFRYHVMFFAILCGAIILFLVALLVLVFLVIWAFSSLLSSNIPANDEKVPAIFENFAHDLPTAQLRSMQFSLGWGLALCINASLIGLAYRFDVHCLDEDITTVSASAKKTILKVNEENMQSSGVSKDSLGLIPIAASTVGIRDIKQTIENNPANLPTFYASMVTFIGMHIFWLCLNFLHSPSFNRPEFPTTWSSVQELPNYAVINFALFLSWPAIMIAMGTVCLLQEGGTSKFHKLWMYSEQWDSDSTDATRSGEENQMLDPERIEMTTNEREE